MTNTQNHDPNHVVPKQCKTCPFRTDDRGCYLVPDLAAKLIIRITTESNHLCHQTHPYSAIPGAVCRGARDYQLNYFHRLGLLSEPTDEAYRSALSKNQQ